MATAETALTQHITTNNVNFAYRRFGKTGGVPILLNMFFRGNMDFWDPLLVNTMAKQREVILFDNAGIGRSTGTVPTTFKGWAVDMIAFVKALGIPQIDLFGYSMGGLAVIEAALEAPNLVRKLIIAAARASVPEHGPVEGIVWPQEESPQEVIMQLATGVTVEEGKEGLRSACFSHDDRGSAAFDRYWQRLSTRTAEAPMLELAPMDPDGNNQYACVISACTPQPGGSFDRLGELKIPVLVLKGDRDALIPPSLSWELLKMIDNCQLIVYPRSGHGFLFQYASRVGDDTNRFLDDTDFV